jgi:hypothetical protein
MTDTNYLYEYFLKKSEDPKDKEQENGKQPDDEENEEEE